MQSGTKMFTVDKFLGLNEGADGNTELRMGEASEMENFLITDGFNLTVRPGIQRMDAGERDAAPILAVWAGCISEDSGREYLVIVDFAEGTDRIWLFTREEDGSGMAKYHQEGALGLVSAEDSLVKILAFGGKLHILSRGNCVVYEDGSFRAEEPYIPLVIAGADPAGGGTALEGINLMTRKRRIDYSADGEAVAFVLPAEAVSVEKILIDNEETAVDGAGVFDSASHTFTFGTAPAKGVGNVEITYAVDAQEAEEARLRILSMPLAEAYNGSTDTRLFVGGKGNTCYYTGIPQTGEVTPLYFPALNYLEVNMTGAAVTGLVRHYSKLLIFTPEGTYTASYEPVTLEDGSTVAGFYLRSANREFGNDIPGQIQTVNNYPRTITRDGIYEWRITSSYYQDERYAKRISDGVCRTLRRADIQKIVTCDNNYDNTYYVFLNDGEGTVLVNRYALTKENIWCVYKGALFREVKQAFVWGGQLFFAGESEIFTLSENAAKDAPVEAGGASERIGAIWKSGFMDFGADFRRKFASRIYVSMLPEFRSEMIITAETDRRSEYMEKTVSNSIFSFSGLDFRFWTFNTNNTPRIQRVRLKVKKFVYYRLVFRVEGDGATATVLGYDQEVRYGSMAK